MYVKVLVCVCLLDNLMFVFVFSSFFLSHCFILCQQLPQNSLCDVGIAYIKIGTHTYIQAHAYVYVRADEQRG